MRGERYLKKPQQYALVYRKGKSWPSSYAVMKALPNGLALSRYGLSVSKRVGKAVTRNRVKRLLREILREMQINPGWDIVFVVQPAAADVDYHTLKGVVGNLLLRSHLLMSGNREKVTREEAEVLSGGKSTT